MPGASWFQDPTHWEFRDTAFQLMPLTGDSHQSKGAVQNCGRVFFWSLCFSVDTIMEGSERRGNPVDWVLVGTDDDSAWRGRTWGQWRCLSFLPLLALARELPQTEVKLWLWHFEVCSPLRFWWRTNEWMKGLFSWGYEQLLPDEWVLATQGGLRGPVQGGEAIRNRAGLWRVSAPSASPGNN